MQPGLTPLASAGRLARTLGITFTHLISPRENAGSSIEIEMSNAMSKTFDFAEHERKLRKTVVESFSRSFMSDAKWRRFFESLVVEDPPVTHLLWKFVGRDLAIRGATPDFECLGDRYIDRTSFARFPYLEIEWVEIPARTELPVNVRAAGGFETEPTTGGVRVYGYRE